LLQLNQQANEHGPLALLPFDDNSIPTLAELKSLATG
jgi:hypothetical protein